MSNGLNSVVTISITRQTQAVSKAGFGTPGILAEFPTSQTTVPFDRYRYYSGLTEMATDGWVVTDEVYLAAQKVFAQNPNPGVVMVGRKDIADADWAAALNAIQAIQNNWYGYSIVPSTVATVVFDIDFVESNSAAFTINGTAVTPVVFITDHATTMAAIITQIESDITDSSVILDPLDEDDRTLIITIYGQAGVKTASVIVTLGATQPVGTFTFSDQGQYELCADWTETQSKLFFIEGADSGIIAATETDIAAYIESNNYDRSTVYYNNDEEYMNMGAMGEAFPYDPGSQTWSYKTISGVTSYELTTTEFNNAIDKNANVFTEIAGVDVTQYGTCGSGEYIDIMRGVDWIEANIKEDIFALFISVRKVPFTDAGITSAEGVIRNVLEIAANMGILIKGTIVISVPERDNVSVTDRANRLLPDITFTADIAGAIHKVNVSGIVSV